MKNFKKKQLNSSNGITLIALVITIIVLLILAGISISMLSGDNGILRKATDAKTFTERASVVEQAKTDVLGYQAENKGTDLQKSQLQSVLETYFKSVPNLTDMSDTEILNTKLETLAKYGTHNITVKEIFDGNFSSSNEITIVEGNIADWETNAAGDKLVKYLGSNEHVIFPNSLNGNLVTTIGSNIFDGKTDIVKTIQISEGITTIEDSAFFGYTFLTGDLRIPDSITAIGKRAFYGCINFNGNLYIGKSVSTTADAINGSTGVVSGWKNIEINIKNIPTDLFSTNGIHDTGIKSASLTIGDNVETIADSVFKNCTSLTGSVSIGANVKSIGKDAFRECTNLESISIPNTIQSIGNNAFMNVAHVDYTGTLDTSNWGAKTYN